jgi:phosphoribosylformylglycinamidine (FGAM) synthase PurS component
VRIGKHVRLYVDATDTDQAEIKVTEACKKLLCNEIMEGFSFTLEIA